MGEACRGEQDEYRCGSEPLLQHRPRLTGRSGQQRANEPNVLAAGEFAHLADIRNYPFEEFDGFVRSVFL